MLEQVCAPGTGAPPDRHAGVEEAVAVLEGCARFFVAAEEAEVAAGEPVLVPAGARHGFTDIGEDVYEDEPEILEIGGTPGPAAR